MTIPFISLLTYIYGNTMKRQMYLHFFQETSRNKSYKHKISSNNALVIAFFFAQMSLDSWVLELKRGCEDISLLVIQT